MFYYTYLVYLTNPNSSLYGCLYFGQHGTENLLDGYIGSGKILKDYLKKYPNDYYRKILNFYNSREELNLAERVLIAPHLGKFYCINLVGGGKAGTPTEQIRKAISIANTGKSRNKGPKNPMWGKSPSEETRMQRSKSLKGKNKGEPPWTKGKPSVTKGKHRVYDNEAHTKWHFEY